MRKVLSFLVIAILSLVFASIAWAEGYNPSEDTSPSLPQPYYTTDPHSNYTTTSNLCKTCHAVHEAVAGYKLLRGPGGGAATAVTACDFCHRGGSPHTQLVVYRNSPVVATHGLDDGTGGSIEIPDSDTGSPGSWTGTKKTLSSFLCNTCHSVHGAKTFTKGSGLIDVMLREDPAGDSGAAATDLKSFCSDCHNRNYDTSKNGITHVMKTAAGSNLAWMRTRYCRDCHAADDGNQDVALNWDYPHTSASYAFLKGGKYDGEPNTLIEASKLDRACLLCHRWKSTGTPYMPPFDSGVGLTY